MKKLKVAVNQCFISTISDYTIPFINYYNKWNTGNVVNGHSYTTTRQPHTTGKVAF